MPPMAVAMILVTSMAVPVVIVPAVAVAVVVVAVAVAVASVLVTRGACGSTRKLGAERKQPFLEKGQLREIQRSRVLLEQLNKLTQLRDSALIHLVCLFVFLKKSNVLEAAIRAATDTHTHPLTMKTRGLFWKAPWSLSTVSL
eukprot:m.121583 g.121583  ORF g.121583 m.121583 type:complete len:143 (-) comp14582_c0_seq1:1347-1775(-)